MGALALLTGLRAGARDVLVSDVNDQRLETMQKLGASTTVNAGKPELVSEIQAAAGRGYDLVIDASGSIAPGLGSSG